MMMIRKVTNELENIKKILLPYENETITLGENIDSSVLKRADCLVKAMCKCARLVESIRPMVVYTVPKETIEHCLSSEVKSTGYGIKVEGELLEITMGALLPKTGERYYGHRKYLNANLERLLQSEVKNIPSSLMNRKQCVVIFEHIRVATCQKFDYDNLEFKNTLDVISDYFLAGDSAQNIDFFNTYSPGEKQMTRITILPKSKFSSWYMSK